MSFIQTLDNAFREFNEIIGNPNVEDEVMYYDSIIQDTENPDKKERQRILKNQSIDQRLCIIKTRTEQALLNLQMAVMEEEQKRASSTVAVGIPAVVDVPSLTTVTATVAPQPVVNLVSSDSDSEDDMPISQMLVARPKPKTTHFPKHIWDNIKSYALPTYQKIKKGDTLCINLLSLNENIESGFRPARIMLVISVSKKSIKYLDYFNTEDNDFDIHRSGYNDPNSGFRECFHERDDENFKSTKIRVERNCIRYGGEPITTEFINTRGWCGGFYPYKMEEEEKARMFRWMEFKQSKRKWKIIERLQ